MGPRSQAFRATALTGTLAALALAALAAPAGAATGPAEAGKAEAGKAEAGKAEAGTALGAGSTPELSVTDQLDQRRATTAGTRAYEVGTQDGRYPALGFHAAGEMGGLWAPPLKLLDGIWFSVDGSWLPPAQRFTSGYGYTRTDYPAVAGVTVSRTDVVPDGRRGLLVGLTLRADRARSVALAVDAHSELMGVYPWGSTTPAQTTVNLPDTAAVQGGRLVFTDRGTPPGANQQAHDWAAVVGAAAGSPLRPTGSTTGPATTGGTASGAGFRGPQDPPRICPVTGSAPPVCDDTGFGRGAGGELRYALDVPSSAPVTVWFAAAGSDRGSAGAQAEFAATAKDPAGQLRAKVAQRRALAARSVVTLPGDPALARAIEWGKQNLADLTQAVGGAQGQPLQVRATNAGVAYPPPAGTVPQLSFIGAGYADYPWLFATDGEYTAYAGVAVGQFRAVEDHLRALRDVSLTVNGRSGKVVHEVTTDGSVFFGANADPGNTDETVKFPSAVALVWRWTGDNAFRDEMYAFARSNLVYATTTLDADRDGWPEGAGNVERAGQGTEKLDNAVYLIRGMLDVAAMAASKGQQAEARIWQTRATALAKRFEQAWWFGGANPGSPTPGTAAAYADSLLDPGDVRVYQRYWTGVTPLEAELWSGGRAAPGLAAAAHARAALDLRESACFTTGSGLVHTGSGATTKPNDPQPYPTTNCAGDAATSDQPDERDSFTLNTAVMAVAEGNYGRLGAGQQQRYTDALAAIMFSPDEMPGAMEEIAPSDLHPPYYGHSLGRALTERASVMQAWGNYGTMWPVLHQQLGVSPDLGNGRLDVVPQVPPSATGPIGGTAIQLGSGRAVGSVDVRASHAGSRYETDVTRRLAVRLTIGHVLPAGTAVASVTLDGRPAHWTVRDTNRGREVLVDAGTAARGTARLVVTTRV